ncbi:hypothetical protein SAMN04489867_1894 [Pedococcus dokdonensis]|uniref:Uncharacterized protein n=1 Tax=Pedococcus dokdonensis TaxID=443156 RepID=A0A1H0RA08_9MICO|nr:hypothetical protein SAMN04489867_1894 [Pedococcus dokdonensis]
MSVRALSLKRPATPDARDHLEWFRASWRPPAETDFWPPVCGVAASDRPHRILVARSRGGGPTSGHRSAVCGPRAGLHRILVARSRGGGPTSGHRYAVCGPRRRPHRILVARSREGGPTSGHRSAVCGPRRRLHRVLVARSRGGGPTSGHRSAVWRHQIGSTAHLRPEVARVDPLLATGMRCGGIRSARTAHLRPEVATATPGTTHVVPGVASSPGGPTWSAGCWSRGSGRSCSRCR